MSLIEGMDPTAAGQPLASRMRPRDLSEFVGQEHLVGEGKLLRQMIERDQIPSMILWGPPGVGKTTLANVVANATKAEFVTYSAVTSGIKYREAVHSLCTLSKHLLLDITQDGWIGKNQCGIRTSQQSHLVNSFNCWETTRYILSCITNEMIFACS